MEKRLVDSKQLTYFEKINTEEHREFVSSHNNCVLCGTVLELRHVPLSEGNCIKEEAYCPECELRTRAKIYTLN